MLNEYEGRMCSLTIECVLLQALMLNEYEGLELTCLDKELVSRPDCPPQKVSFTAILGLFYSYIRSLLLLCEVSLTAHGKPALLKP